MTSFASFAFVFFIVLHTSVSNPAYALICLIHDRKATFVLCQAVFTSEMVSLFGAE